MKREQMKCQYCGAETVLRSDGSSILRTISACPQCGSPVEKSSWFCLTCNTVLTNDSRKLNYMLQLQKELRYKQLCTRDCLPSEIVSELEADEFIYDAGVIQEGNDFFALTDKRLIHYKDGVLQKIPWSEIVSVTPVIRGESSGLFSRPAMTYYFEVYTLDGTIVFEGIEKQTSGITFRNAVFSALSSYNSRGRDVRAIIWRLPLHGGKEGGSSDQVNKRALCGNCGFFGKPLLCKSHQKDPQREPCRDYVRKPES